MNGIQIAEFQRSISKKILLFQFEFVSARH
jgi:hypothetical protein